MYDIPDKEYVTYDLNTHESWLLVCKLLGEKWVPGTDFTGAAYIKGV